MALRQLYRDEEKYRKILVDVMTQESESRTRKYKQLNLLAQPERLRISTAVCERAGGRKDLVYPVDPTTKAVAEEVVVNIQGYAVRTNLPPVTRKDSLPKNPVNMKQSIVLTGVGTKQFDQAARAVLAIRSLFSTTLPGDTLIPWTPIMDGGHQCLEFSNRYFTSGHMEGTKPVEFGSGVDPKGILANLDVNGMHTDDNVVLYFERVEGQTAKYAIHDAYGYRAHKLNLPLRDYSYQSIKPVSIKPGALVEVQASFCVVPIAKGRHIMLNKLRSICVLNRQVIDDADDTLFTGLSVDSGTSITHVKRSVGYLDEASDTEGSGSAMKRLRLDDREKLAMSVDDT